MSQNRRIRTTRFVIAALLLSTSLSAQQPSKRKKFNLVMPLGNGRIIIPAPNDDLQWVGLTLYDQGTRPVFQTHSKSANVVMSYILFPNKTGSSSPKVCRDDIVSAGIRSLSPAPGLADIKQIRKEDRPSINGQEIAIGSYLVSSVTGAPVDQKNLFVVTASATQCAEMHLSKVAYKASDDALLNQQAETFVFEPRYIPTTEDYYTTAAVFYSIAKSYGAAAIYYQRTLDTLPADAPLQFRRVITDQLAMSYGISGQLKQSRAVNEAAIKSDPDYPLYYYNLACADAEQGHAADAKVHLQEAFARKANVLSGEKLPDPTKDDSILKLKKNKEFWAFVETLK